MNDKDRIGDGPYYIEEKTDEIMPEESILLYRGGVDNG